MIFIWLTCSHSSLILRRMRIQKTRPCEWCNGTGERENAAYRGGQMRALRKSAGLSLREVARRLDFSAAYISDLELGRRDWSEKLIKIYEKALR